MRGYKRFFRDNHRGFKRTMGKIYRGFKKHAPLGINRLHEFTSNLPGNLEKGHQFLDNAEEYSILAQPLTQRLYRDFGAK